MNKTQTRRDETTSDCMSVRRAVIKKSVNWVGICVGEPGEQLLIDSHQQTVVGRCQLRLLHREVGVKVTHIIRRRL